MNAVLKLTTKNGKKMRKIALPMLLASASPTYADVAWSVSGEFEYDHVSVKDADTANDLSKAEIAVSADVGDDVSAEIVIAGVDAATDNDSSVDDGIEIDAAIVTYRMAQQNLSFDVGLMAAPVGQFETLSVSDPLGLGEVETTRNRGLVATLAPNDAFSITAFSGTMDDTASTSVNGGNIQLTWKAATFNIGHISDTAGSISDAALTYAVNVSHAGYTLIAEKVEMDDAANTGFTHIEMNYGFNTNELPITLGVGQSTQSQNTAGDTTQTSLTMAIELTENFGLTFDTTNLEAPGVADADQTALKIGFSF